MNTLPQIDVRAYQLEDSEINFTIEALRRNLPVHDRYKHQTSCLVVQDGVLYRWLKYSQDEPDLWQLLVIPQSLCYPFFQQLHHESGHFGYNKTFRKIQERGYWPTYSCYKKQRIQNCSQCQRCNSPPTTPRATIISIETSRPFQKVVWDFMGPLPPLVRGNRYILVITDLFKKWVEAFPLKEMSSETLARVLFNEVICRFGTPEVLHSDQGKNLWSNLIQSLCDLLGIQRTNTTAYHPHGNGQTERFNCTLEAMLAKVLQDDSTHWDDHIPRVLFAYHTAVHESTQFTLFSLLFGRTPNLPVDVMLGKPDTAQLHVPLAEFVENTRKKMQNLFTDTRQRLTHARAQQKKFHDQHSHPVIFDIGSKVWLYHLAIPKGSTKKFASPWKGHT